jgi:serine/threonine protein kinase
VLDTELLLQDRYRIVRQIGQGGMGSVYEAIDERLKNRVALKQMLAHTLNSEQREALSRAFEREAQILASLRHPALPRVIDHFATDAGQFLVMEFIPGDDLGKLLAHRGVPFSIAEVLRWADQLLDALDYLHTQEPAIIHRDIKPQNLKLTNRNEIILLDFGLAKGLPKLISSPTQLTAAGSTMASLYGYTPQYAPLEQIQGTGTNPRSDLYALAATLYHLLTGAPPTDVLSRAAAVLNRQADPLRPATELRPDLSPAISQILGMALSLAANERPASAATMREQLRVSSGAATANLSNGHPTTANLPTVIASDSTPTVGILTPNTQATLLVNEHQPLDNPTTGTTSFERRPRRKAGWRRWLAIGVIVLGVAGLGVAGRTIWERQRAPVVPSAEVVSQPDGNPDEPQLAFDGQGNLHLVWIDEAEADPTASGLAERLGRDVFHRLRTPDGAWSQINNLTDQYDVVENDLRILTTPSGQVCTFWRGTPNGRAPAAFGLYQSCRDTGGAWSTPETAEQRALGARFEPALTAEGQLATIFAFPATQSIRFGDLVLAENDNLTHPAFAIDSNGRYHAVWTREGRPFSLEYRSSSDGGTTWEPVFTLTDANTSPFGPARLHTDAQGQLHMIWSHNGSLLYRIWAPTNGWGAVELIANEWIENEFSLTVTPSGQPHVVWTGSNGPGYATRPASGGWSSVLRLGNQPVGSPVIAVDRDGRIMVSWKGRDEVFFVPLPANPGR